MHSLTVIVCAAGLVLSALPLQEALGQSVDSLVVESVVERVDLLNPVNGETPDANGKTPDANGKTPDTNGEIPDASVDAVVKQAVQPAHQPVKDSLKQGLPRTSRVKNNQTSVKNSNEVTMPEVPDLNPLLTQIMLYDPELFKVYPREARVVEPEDALGFLKAESLFRPLVFGAIQPDLRLDRAMVVDTSTLLISPHTDSLTRAWHYQGQAAKAYNRFMMALEVNHVERIVYEAKNMPRPEKLVYFLQQERPMVVDRPTSYTFGKEEKQTGYLPGLTYNPWTTKGNYKLHFSETYVSPNWARGGESNMAGLASIILEANYNNLKGVQFDNNIELKIGMNTSPSDTLRSLNVSTDQLRAVSKLGIRMKNNWYYSLSSEFTTQVLNNYKKNTMSLKSSFMSPARLFVSLGVDYKKSDNKKGYNLSVMLSPLTYKLNYLHDNINLKPASYGIDQDKHFGSEIGSKVSSTLSWRFSERLNWKSKIYYFTDYTYVDSEWENTVDVMLNHYFSTQIFVHLKLDDRIERQTGESLLQLQQLLSFGMTYYF